jgi:hypothetical protein
MQRLGTREAFNVQHMGPVCILSTSNGFQDQVLLYRGGGGEGGGGHLRGSKHFSEGPHECTVDSHELLHVHLISLIQHHPHLVIMPLQRAYHLSHHTRGVNCPQWVRD